MKHFSLLLAAFLVLRAAAIAQSLPDSPTPVPAPDPAWVRVQSLVEGQPVVIRNDNEAPVHCLFAGATDAYLFCDPPGNPPGVGFRFDRASVISVDLDRPTQFGPHFNASQRNYHPAWIASMLAGGLIVGICATRTTDAGTSAEAGLIAAGVVGLIGAPLAFLPHSAFTGAGPAYPQFGVAIPLRRSFGFHMHLRSAPRGSW
jgi:hypothetical protein